MKEKIKNFLLKIKNYFTDKFACTRIKLIFFAFIVSFITCLINMVNFTFTDTCFNETHTEQVEIVETERNIIDRDINGANGFTGTPIISNTYIEYIYFNTELSIDVVVAICQDIYDKYSLGGVVDLIEYSNKTLTVAHVGGAPSATWYIGDFLAPTIYFADNLNAGYSNFVGWNTSINGRISVNSTISTNIDLTPYSILFSSQPFDNDSSIVDTSILTLNETNYEGVINFSTFLTKETIAGYFSQLTFEETNFITPSLSLNNVDSYTIITGRIGTPSISNYIPSLVVVKFDSKYVVYNYLRDNYLTPIYDTSTGVLQNVLGDGNYFLNVSSPTYFGSENDKFNLFISAINIADSPLYSLISIGYENGYDFGYGRGYNVGSQEGFADGEESGFNEGYDTGYENGFVEGRDTANPLAPVMSLFKGAGDVLSSVFNVQILPNITIGTILLFPIVALLFALFVRLFFGG